MIVNAIISRIFNKIIKKEALKFSNSEELKDKTGYNNIDDTDPDWEHYIKS